MEYDSGRTIWEFVVRRCGEIEVKHKCIDIVD